MNKSTEVTTIKNISGFRKREITIDLPRGKKVFSTPCFFIEPVSAWDLDYICQWVENPAFSKQSFQGIIIPFNKVKKFLSHKEAALQQKTLSEMPKESGYETIKNQLMIIIDPKPEAAYLNLIKPDEEGLKDFPIEYVTQITNINQTDEMKRGKKRINKLRLYRAYVDEVTKKVNSYTLKYLLNINKSKTHFLLAPSNLVVPEIPESLALAIEINKETHKICETREGWTPAAYFVLKTACFEDGIVPSKIIEYVSSEKPSMLFFKIVDSYGLDSRNAALQRYHLKGFLQQLAKISETYNIPVFCLNVDSLGLFLLMAGIDGFSVPSNGLVEPVFVSNKNTDLPDYQRGKYFFVKYLSLISMRALEGIYERSGKIFPCPYKCCDRYNKTNFKNLIGKTKAELTRTHYFNSMDKLVLEAHKALNDNNARAAFSKLAESSCKHFLELLPNFS